MNKNELVIESRYIHTGNSGATFELQRDAKYPNKALLNLKLGAMGRIKVDVSLNGNGNNFGGFTAVQLKDLALMFMSAAKELEKPVEEQEYDYTSPHLIDEDGNDYNGQLPKKLEKYLEAFLREKYNISEYDYDDFKRAAKEERKYSSSEIERKRIERIGKKFTNKLPADDAYNLYIEFKKRLPSNKQLIEEFLKHLTSTN